MTNEQGAGFVFETGGLGPAVLKFFYVYVDGKPQGDWHSFYRVLDLPSPMNYRYTVPYDDVPYLQNTSKRLFWVPPGAAADRLRSVVHRTSINICYASLYEELWFWSSEGREETGYCPRMVPEGLEMKAPPEDFGGEK
jgi:hypothetical protein